MESTPFTPRANVPVGNGPTGQDSWTVVSTDPSGTLVKPAGTIAYHLRGLLGWLNCQGTVGSWVALAALQAVSVLSSIVATLQAVAAAWTAGARWPGISGSLAAAATTLDLTNLACDTKGGFVATFAGLTVDNVGNVWALRVNGGAAAGRSLHMTAGFLGTSNWGLANYADSNVFQAAAAAGKPWKIVVRYEPQSSGFGRAVLCVDCYVTEAASDRMFGFRQVFDTGLTVEIDSVGITTNGALKLGAGTTYYLRRL